MSDAETFSPEDPYAPRRQKSGCAIVALILGLIGGGVLLVVLCCTGAAWFGVGMIAEQVKTDLRDNPVIVEHVGPITSIRTDWVATAAAPGSDEFVFDIEGPRGKGRIQVVKETVDADTERVVSGTLELPNGDRHDLFPHEEEAATDDAAP